MNIGAANIMIEPPRPIWQHLDPGFNFESVTGKETLYARVLLARRKEIQTLQNNAECVKGIIYWTEFQ